MRRRSYARTKQDCRRADCAGRQRHAIARDAFTAVAGDNLDADRPPVFDDHTIHEGPCKDFQVLAAASRLKIADCRRYPRAVGGDIQRAGPDSRRFRVVVIDGLGKANTCANLVERRLGWREIRSRGTANFDRTTLPVMGVNNIDIALDGAENGLDCPPIRVGLSYSRNLTNK
jgi:hypothetical protein